MSSKYTPAQLDSIAVFGLNFFEQGKLDDAQTMFNGLIAVDRNNFRGWAGMGAIALAKEPPKLDEAEKFLTVAVQLNPNDPSVRANLGEVFVHQKKFREAAAEFQKALELDPEKRDRGANRARAILRAIQQMRQQHRPSQEVPASA